MKTRFGFSSLLLGIGLLSGVVQAQIPWATEPFSRAEKVEFYGIGQYLNSDDIKFDGPNGQTRLKVDDTGLGGLGMAYHFNDFFSIRGDLMFGSATLQSEGPPGNTALGLAHDAFIQTGRLNLDYNIINRRLTPFVTAGIGYQYLEAELEQHPDVAICWWDPWWGYYCEYGKPVHSETSFTWNVGAGLRWNVTDHFFMKATGGIQWLNYDDASGLNQQIEGIFSIGWMF